MAQKSVAVRRSRSRCALVLFGLCLLHALGAHAADPVPKPPRELIRDPHFQQGFHLIETTPGRRVSYAQLPGPRGAGTIPIWDLDQWSSRFPLVATSAESWRGGVIACKNSAKTVRIGKPGSGDADLVFGVDSNVEYSGRLRREGEPWVHLLAEQTIEGSPSIAEMKSARFRISARLNSSHRVEGDGYSTGLHAAQFQVFFSVQNLNRKSPGYGHYLWFGVPLYDDRSRFPKAHKTQDTGGTGMFIFTPGGETFASEPVEVGKWVSVDKDLLPLIRDGLEAAWTAGFLIESQSAQDYRIAGMNLGWEVPGTFAVEMQVRDLSLTVTP